MRNFIAFFCFISLLSGEVYAQTSKDSVAVYANVKDSFTYEILKGVRVEIMRQDSTLIDEFSTDQIYRYGGYLHNVDRLGYLYIPRTTCIFRFTKDGYLPKTITLSRKTIGKREKRVFLGEIVLKKKPKTYEQELGEAVVTASKIRMVVKGDTVVYNADAFQLAEGSMLDGLMKCLPGFELRDGQIRVNGRYVSSLLVNGEDFFRGDPRVALENLPAYMVDKVKVYHKEHDYSYITQERDKNDLPLVVDVNLKRQYAIGWVANAGVGYGLQDRYLGRLFALRFTDNSRLAVFGNLNNTNDTREPGVTGDWNAQGAVSGRTEMQTGGFEALIKDKKGVWKYTGNAKVAHRKTDNRSITSQETFHPGESGSTFSRASNQSMGKALQVQTDHKYTYKKETGYVIVQGDAAYREGRSESERLAAEFAADPKDAYRAASLDSLFLGTSERLAALFIHRQSDQRKEHADRWNGGASMEGYVMIPHTPDYLRLTASVRVEKLKATSFSDYQLNFNPTRATAADDHRLHYATSPSFTLDAHLNATYHFRPEWGWMEFSYDLKDKYSDTDYSLYRLDRLGEEAPTFGMLPSTLAALENCIDAPNSYTSTLNTLKHLVGTDIGIWLPGKLPSHRITFKPAVEWQTDHLAYHRDLLQTRPHRSKVAFKPSASWGFEGCYLNYQFTADYPDILSMLDYTDDADPLNIYRGNPNLKRSTTHAVDASRSFADYQKGWHVYLTGKWNMTRNAIAHAMDYDAQTGVRTYSPRNVNGNWGSSFSIDYQQPLDKQKRFVLTSVTDLNYRNSVDYVTERSSVRNLHLGERLRLNTRIKQSILNVDLALKYLHATSPRDHFEEINSFDIKYGVSAQIPLPGKIALSADLTVYHRAGYTDESLNDCRVIANARLARSFLKGRLGLSIEAFDIFHGLSNVTKTLNAQGITETWHNSLPSYAMLQLVYKFSKQPKKK